FPVFQRCGLGSTETRWNDETVPAMAGTATGNLSGRQKQLFLCWQLGLFGNRRLGGGIALHQTRWMPFVALLLALGLAAAALAQEGGSAAPQGGAPEEPVTAEPVPDTPAQIVIEVPS